MSGFLTNLLARSFGEAQTLRPHVPSLFEPLRAEPGPQMATGFRAGAEPEKSLLGSGARIVVLDGRTVGPDEQEQEMVRSEDAVAPARHEHEASALQPSMPDKPAGYGAKGFSAPPPSEFRDRISSAWPPRLAAGNIPPVSALPLRGSSPPSLELLFERATATKDGTREETIGTSAPPPPRPRHTRVVTVARVSASEDGHDSKLGLPGPDNALPLAWPAPARETYMPQALPVQSPALPKTGGPREQTQPGRRFDQRKSQDQQRSASDESTIQVTIGRIEIRAESSASPNFRERSAPKPMSLEDYLHRRADRGR
jgi:hypothetical protein